MRLPTGGSDLQQTLLKQIDALISDTSITVQDLASEYHQISGEIVQYHEFTDIRENIQKAQEKLEDSFKRFNSPSFEEIFKKAAFEASKSNALLCILLINSAFLKFLDVILFHLIHYNRNFDVKRSQITHLGELFYDHFQTLEDKLNSTGSSHSEIGLYFYATILQSLFF